MNDIYECSYVYVLEILKKDKNKKGVFLYGCI